jgi:hypothetical protein
MNKSSNIQAPSSREIPNTKLQSVRVACLEFEVWCFSGAWMLELGALSAAA